jgi:hypothetical protein
MPAVNLEPPKPGTYKRVLVRTDYDWDLMYGFHYYDEDVDSRGIMHRGVRLMTIFLNSENAIIYALKTGWLDRSETWFTDHPDAWEALKSPESRSVEGSPPAPPRSPSTESAVVPDESKEPPEQQSKTKRGGK